MKEITNSKTIYDKLPKFISEYAMRLKQSSDVKVEKKVTAYLKICDKASTDLIKKAEASDLYHVQSALEKKTEDLCKKTDTFILYDNFKVECSSFLEYVAQATSNR